MSNIKYTGLEVAIIGMACKVPGANNWREFWTNLLNGKESIKFLSRDELLNLGLDEATINNPNFVNIKNGLSDKDLFDASFFNYTPTEAEIMNPVHRVFHQCVWEALEDAGYSSDKYKGLIGIYAGSGEDLDWRVYSTLLQRYNKKIDDFTLRHINSKDYLTSLVAYNLNLKGPSLSLYTGCSTSLVAINMACKSLLLGEAKIALAGGISLTAQIQRGYIYEDGMIFSSDGHCRTFDKDSNGTVLGEGAGVVVLKKLADAIKDKDNIYAIIKGSAINNDGNRKVGYTAPSVEGQLDCIRKAQKIAQVEPETIGYIEAHGTATRLGDPIEIEALNIAFKNNKEKKCAIGSVKTNLGHLDSAAGVVGLIKTALSLKYKCIPKSLNFKEPNPNINFNDGPFFVNSDLRDWYSDNKSPRRAGVSSFAIGGTNAHAILEEYREENKNETFDNYKILNLSAKTNNSLIRYIDKLKSFLIDETAINLADMSFTLDVGRKHFSYRKSIVYKDRAELLGLLNQINKNDFHLKSDLRNNSIVFMFAGQGSQFINMAKGLYDELPEFRKLMDNGFSLIEKLCDKNFKTILFSESNDLNKINETYYTQPILFLIEYSLASFMISIGIKPKYMIGHSLGEYTAACISGLFSFEDSLRLVLKRAELMNSIEKGSMLATLLKEEEAEFYLNDSISIAAINGPEQVVFSGNYEAILSLKVKLDTLNIKNSLLNTSHAFHSVMQDQIMEAYREEVKKITFNKLKIPFISNLTGSIITEMEATSPEYWVRHMRETVRFSKGIKYLLSLNTNFIFIEFGAAMSLVNFLRQHNSEFFKATHISIIRSSNLLENDMKFFLDGLGKLWSAGVDIDWSIYYKDDSRSKISLPTYSFELNKYTAEIDLFKNGLFVNKDLETFIKEDSIKNFDDIKLYKRERSDYFPLKTYIAPETSSEKILAQIFEAFFNIERIGVDDNFFELGGDSLKAMSILEKIKVKFNVNISLNDFFEYQTIKQIGLHLDELQFLIENKSKKTKNIKI